MIGIKNTSVKNSQVMQIERTRLGRPKIKEADAADKVISSLVIIFLMLSIYTLCFRVEYKWEHFSPEVATRIFTEFLRFDMVDPSIRLEMINSLFNTLLLGFITTVTGLVVGIPLGLLAARNLSNKYVANVIRGLAALTRAIPTAIWVLIFVAGYGLTSTTAIVGMFFHSVAFFIKSFAESFEEVDKGTIEALRATGSNWFQIIFGAVIPSSMTKIVAWVAIRTELNFAVAVVIGPAVGVPGTIGSLVNNAARIGDYSTQGFGVFLIFITAFMMELGINKLRRSL